MFYMRYLYSRNHSMCILINNSPLSHLNLLSTAIINQQVRRSLRVTNDIGDSKLQDPVSNLLGRYKTALQAPKVAHQAGDKRRRHAGASLGCRARIRAVASRNDVLAGCENIQLGAVGAAVDTLNDVDTAAIRARHADGEGLGKSGGGGVGGGLIVVAGRDDGENALVVGSKNSVVEGRDVLGAQRHVEDGLALCALSRDVVDSPVEAGKDG